MKRRKKKSESHNAVDRFITGGTWVDDDCHPCEPCIYTPGSQEKIAVLQFRIANGQHLFHEEDLTFAVIKQSAIQSWSDLSQPHVS